MLSYEIIQLLNAHNQALQVQCKRKWTHIYVAAVFASLEEHMCNSTIPPTIIASQAALVAAAVGPSGGSNQGSDSGEGSADLDDVEDVLASSQIVGSIRDVRGRRPDVLIIAGTKLKGPRARGTASGGKWLVL